MQAIGNDFVVLDLFQNPLPRDTDYARLAIVLCDRHTGVGGDGLLSLEPATDGNAARMRMWNPDGSEDMCGNGLRCIAALAAQKNYVRDSRFTLQTLAGTRHAEILKDGLVRVSMGQPDFAPQNVPTRGDSPLIEGQIELEGRVFSAVTSLSTGSTHTVIFSDQPVTPEDFEFWSPKLEVAPFFPERTSVLWATPEEKNRFRVRIWERGVGETLACGTGACAVAVAAQVTGRAQRELPVQIESKGGVLNIWWEQESDEIWKTGPAQMVFEGEFLPQTDEPTME